MATVPAPAPKCDPVSRGFGFLPCPLCGESNVRIALAIDALDADDACKCESCDQPFALSLIRDILNSNWSAVLAWCDAAPPVQE